MASFSTVFSLLFTFFAAAGAQQNQVEISFGSSLSPSTPPTAWHSPSGRFAFGFYSQGSGFSVGIWLVSRFKNTTVWTAKRDDPPVSSKATLVFSSDGKLVLTTEQNVNTFIADPPASASFASMLDNGNFVLFRSDNEPIWESFDFPTDTMIGGQNLCSACELASSLSRTNHSTGRFRLKMQDDGNLVMYPMNTRKTGSNSYWNSDTSGGFKHHLFLNNTGELQLINNTDSAIIKKWPGSSSFNNTVVIYRATLDYDGNFRLYAHSFDPIRKSETLFVVWEALDNVCQVKGYCGFNSYCASSDNQTDCICLPGTDVVDPTQTQLSLGCERNFHKERCKGGKENTTLYNITIMENLDFYDVPYFQGQMPQEDCSKSCLEDCNCDVALFKWSYCMKHKFPLSYVKEDINVKSSTALFKMGMRSIKTHNESSLIPIPAKDTTNSKTWMLILVISLGLVTYSCVALAFSGFFIYKFRVLKYRRLLEIGNLGLPFTIRSYTYKELMKATNGFKEELGKGSFGRVYKGSLYRGKKLIAVKRLEKVVDEGEREFRAEMKVIGRTHHKNLVRLLGYCAEGLKRLLVYEYMRNGTLADLLFRAERRPNWNERVRIALEVARGILYLHEECEAPIIHCDIKPQNILMDDFWTAKISDFGLAKLLMPDQTRTFTGIRGTRGYLAPEWQKNIPISVKVDIFSYGIVLLEIVCCRRNLEVNNGSKPEEIVLSSWAYRCFVAGELDKLVGGEEVDKKTLDGMIKVALWCIQDEPALRPSIKSVVLMLEGMTHISVPPCPNDT